MCGEAPAAGATGTARDCCWGRRAPVFDRVLALGLNTYRLYIARWIAASGGSQGGREPKPGSSTRSWRRPPRGAGGSSDHEPSAYPPHERPTGYAPGHTHLSGGRPAKSRNRLVHPGALLPALLGGCRMGAATRGLQRCNWTWRTSAATGRGGQAPRLDVEDKCCDWVSSEHFDVAAVTPWVTAGFSQVCCSEGLGMTLPLL